MNTVIESCQEFLSRQFSACQHNPVRMFDKHYLNFYLMLTQNCNLNCSFCYQSKNFKKDNLMSKEVVDDAIRFILRLKKDERLVITLFGGEPFLNEEALRYLIEKYPMLQFTVPTNGLKMLQDESLRQWVMDHKNNLRVSFSVNNLKQLYGNEFLNKGMSILEVVKNNGGDVHFVFDNPEEDGLIDKIKFLADYGLPHLRFSVAKETPQVLEKKEEYKKLFREVAEYIYITINKKFGCNWDAIFRSNVFKCIKEFSIGQACFTCGAGFHYLAIDHKGDLYPCDYFIDFPEFKLGSIYTGLDSDFRTLKFNEDWLHEVFSYCDPCPLGDVRLCPNAMCWAENYKVNRNIFKPTKNICAVREIECDMFNYLSRRLVETGKDKLYGYSRALQ